MKAYEERFGKKGYAWKQVWKDGKQIIGMTAFYAPEMHTVDSVIALRNAVNDIICENLTDGLSTFYGYYVLEALAKAGNVKAAMDVIRDYWGGMLDVGATTFWEDFDIKWLCNAGRIEEIPEDGKVDVHVNYGKFCYTKLRHSLCHGWASGPAPFISKHILGVQILEAGCKKIKISPNLGNLKWVKGTYPTPFGVVEIEHELQADGKLLSKVNAPKEIEIIVE